MAVDNAQQLKELVDQMPDPDGRGMYTENIDKEKIDRAIAQIHSGGSEYVLGLIDMLGEPGSEADVKPHYALHCLANHVLVVKDEAGRKRFCETLAEQLGSDRSVYVRAYLCQELGWAGRREAVSALGKLLSDNSLCGPAAMALMAIRDGAAAEFRKAWPNATGELRRHVMDGLAALAEPSSAVIFKQSLRDEDREVRVAAAAGLASVGQPDSVSLLLEAAGAAAGWERIQLTKNCLVLAERLAQSGHQDAAGQIYRQLHETRSDKSEQHIRDAAQRGLAAIA